MPRTAVWLFLFFAALYALVSPGVLNNPDSATRFLTAVSMARDRSVELHFPGIDLARYETVRDVHGQWVELFSEGQSLLLAPFVAVCRHLPLGHGNPLKTLEFLTAAVFFPAASALAVVALFFFLRLFCEVDRINLAACALFGAGTCQLVYAYNGQHEALVALFLILHGYGLIRYFRGDGIRFLVGAAVALGLIVMLRPNLVIYAPVSAVWLLVEERRRGRPWVGSQAVLAGVSFAAFSPQLACNALKTGHPLELPYSMAGLTFHYLFRGSMLHGALVCLASPGKSLLLFNPILAVSAVLFVVLFRRLVREPFFPVFIYGFVNAVFTLPLLYWTSYGEISWGARFFAHTAWMMVLPAWYALRVAPGRALMAAVCVAGALGLLVNGLGTLYASELDYGAVRVDPGLYGNADLAWVPVLAYRLGDAVRLVERRAAFVPRRFRGLKDAGRYFVPQWWWVRFLHLPEYGLPARAVEAVALALAGLLAVSGGMLVRAARR